MDYNITNVLRVDKKFKVNRSVEDASVMHVVRVNKAFRKYILFLNVRDVTCAYAFIFAV